MAFNFIATSSESITTSPTAVGTADIGSGAFTFACWFDQDTSSGIRTLMSFGDSGNTRNYVQLQANRNNKLQFATRDATTGLTAIADTNALNNNQWYHAAATLSSTGLSYQYLYLDGSEITNVASEDFPTNDCDIVTLASHNDTAHRNKFDGQMAECAIWSVDIGAEAIAELANGLSPLLVRPEKLLWYWPLNDHVNSVAGESAFGNSFAVQGSPNLTGPLTKKIYYPSGLMLPRPKKAATFLLRDHEDVQDSTGLDNIDETWLGTSGNTDQFSQAPEAGLEGSCAGFKVTFDGTGNTGYMHELFTPPSESIRLRFAFDPNGITNSGDAAHEVMPVSIRQNTGGGGLSIYFELKETTGAGSHQVRAGVFDGDLFGGKVFTSWYSITDAPHIIEIGWTNEGPGDVDNGRLIFWIDGVEQERIEDVAHDSDPPGQIRAGLISNDVDYSGSFYMDNFEIKGDLLPYHKEPSVCSRIQPTETVFACLTLVKTVDETEEIDEGVEAHLAMVRSVDESESISETVEAHLAMVRAIDETEEVDEDVRVSLAVRVDENVEIDEDVQTLKGVVQSIDETEQVSETVEADLAIVRTADETVEIDEAVEGDLAIVRQIDETEEISEATEGDLALVRVIDETEEIEEATEADITTSGALVETVGEVEQISENVQVCFIPQLDLDYVQVIEGVEQHASLTRTVDETEEISDAAQAARIREVGETVEISDDARMGRIATIGEAVEISETVEAQLAMLTVQTDGPIQISETVSRVLGFVRRIDETENIANPPRIVRFTRIRVIDETVQVAEVISVKLPQQVNETEEISEQINRLMAMVRSPDPPTVEVEQIVEAVIPARVMARQVDEDVSIGETVQMTRVQVLDETVQISETTASARGFFQVINETVQIPETVERLMAMVRVVDENENVIEQALRPLSLIRAVDEVEQVTEAESTVGGLVRIVDETEQVGEAVATTVTGGVDAYLEFYEFLIRRRRDAGPF